VRSFEYNNYLNSLSNGKESVGSKGKAQLARPASGLIISFCLLAPLTGSSNRTKPRLTDSKRLDPLKLIANLIIATAFELLALVDGQIKSQETP
jgi:hypothetical protein